MPTCWSHACNITIVLRKCLENILMKKNLEILQSEMPRGMLPLETSKSCVKLSRVWIVLYRRGWHALSTGTRSIGMPGCVDLICLHSGLQARINGSYNC